MLYQLHIQLEISTVKLCRNWTKLKVLPILIMKANKRIKIISVYNQNM